MCRQPLWLVLLSLSEVDVALPASSSPPSLLGGETDLGVIGNGADAVDAVGEVFQECLNSTSRRGGGRS